MEGRERPRGPDDLAAIERALLGVLCVGLPPARAAGDDAFRVDRVTARVLGLLEGDGARHLDGDRATAAFRQQLREAMAALAAAGVLADQPAGAPLAAGGVDPALALDVVEPDAHPAVLDRHLAQECMESLFAVKAVYPYLMERYAASGTVWRRLRADGYGE